MDSSFDIPVDEYDGKITYGEKKGKNGGIIYEGHLDQLAPSVEELKKLEYLAQTTFLNMRTGGSW